MTVVVLNTTVLLDSFDVSLAVELEVFSEASLVELPEDSDVSLSSDSVEEERDSVSSNSVTEVVDFAVVRRDTPLFSRFFAPEFSTVRKADESSCVWKLLTRNALLKTCGAGKDSRFRRKTAKNNSESTIGNIFERVIRLLRFISIFLIFFFQI